jgi:hypothetical protein
MHVYLPIGTMCGARLEVGETYLIYAGAPVVQSGVIEPWPHELTVAIAPQARPIRYAWLLQFLLGPGWPVDWHPTSLLAWAWGWLSTLTRILLSWIGVILGVGIARWRLRRGY